MEAAIRACCERRFGSSELKGRTIAVVGVGRVGSRLAKRLGRSEARLLVADIDPSKRALAASLPRTRWTDPSSALQADVDVLAPCALGGAVDEVTVGRLRCQVLCGSANNQLAHEGLAEDLRAHDILYGPDFVANAGGLINIAVELEGYDPRRARQRVLKIGDTMRQVLERAEADGVTPVDAAYALAHARLAS